MPYMTSKDDSQTRIRAALSAVLFAGDRRGQRRLAHILAHHKNADRTNVNDAELRQLPGDQGGLASVGAADIHRTKKHYSGRPKASGEIRLSKLRAGVDVDLAQDRIAAVNEAVRRVRGNDDDAAGCHFARFISDCNRGRTFERERDLDVRMRM